MHVFVINQAYKRSFGIVDDKHAILDPIAIWSLTAVPFAFTSLLPTSCHRLRLDVFTLQLGDTGQNRKEDFSGSTGRINPIFHADQVYAKVLHNLQVVQYISGVTPETGQLEHQHVIDMILIAVLYPAHHFLKLRPAGSILAGFSLVRKGSNYLHTAVSCLPFQTVLLCIQTISVHLHLCGNAGIEIAVFLCLIHMWSPP